MITYWIYNEPRTNQEYGYKVDAEPGAATDTELLYQIDEDWGDAYKVNMTLIENECREVSEREYLIVADQ